MRRLIKIQESGLGALAIIALALIPFGAHIVWCIQMADKTGSAIALLIVGVIFAPLGWIHGVSVLLGYGWL